MGRYTFFNDFLCTDIENHMEALKEMARLGPDDDRFLVPALFHLAAEKDTTASKEGKGGAILNELQQHDPNCHRQDLKKNVVRMVRVISSLQVLRGHGYNIYECCYLYPYFDVMTNAVLCLVLQLVLSVLIFTYNIDKFTSISFESTDNLVIAVSISTTIFFLLQVLNQSSNAWHFNGVFWAVGSNAGCKKACLFVNIAINGGLGVLIMIFNFVLLLTSENVNDAILNSVALYFILEMDDVMKPIYWDDTRIEDEIGINLFAYITCGGEQVKVTLMKTLEDDEQCNSNQDEYQALLESDDKVYISIWRKNAETGEESDAMLTARHYGEKINPDCTYKIKIYWRKNMVEYQKYEFLVEGEQKVEFLRDIQTFICRHNSEKAFSNGFDSKRRHYADVGFRQLQSLEQIYYPEEGSPEMSIPFRVAMIIVTFPAVFVLIIIPFRLWRSRHQKS